MDTSATAARSPLVLVIDDDPDTRENLCDILELDGYRHDSAGTAAELWSRQEWDEVALVLLDRQLPDGSPQEILPRLKQLAPQAAVVIVTGHADVEGAISALQRGAADYLLKPVSADVLRTRIGQIIRHQRDELEIARLSAGLASSEIRYRSLFENTLDGLVIFDDQWRIVAANPAACTMFGWPPDEAGDKRLNSLTVRADGRARPAIKQDFFAAEKSSGERSLVVDEGETIDSEYRAVENFTPGYHLLSLRDITARKQAVERARQSERLAAIGETMAALVHESRNALQRSKASLEMLRLEVEDRPEALKFVGRVEKAQEDLHQLFEEVRQWAAPLNLRREKCDLRELWRETWVLVRQAHPDRRTKLEETLDCEPVCLADPFALGQVFRNIFENAVEVSPPDGAIHIRCACQANGQGDEICIAIRDQGPGLSPEQQRRIFEPFFTTKSKGTGLGMAIAQRVVHSHGGAIAASSPQGAQIEIRLPRGEA